MEDSKTHQNGSGNEPKSILSESLGTLQTGSPQVFRDLSVLPIFGAEYSDPGYSLLAESINSGGLTVEEVSESGVVGKLRVINEGDSDILLVDGEELSGAKQNRILNTSVFVAASQTLECL